jgi:hypothetical protein
MSQDDKYLGKSERSTMPSLRNLLGTVRRPYRQYENTRIDPAEKERRIELYGGMYDRGEPITFVENKDDSL